MKAIALIITAFGFFGWALTSHATLITQEVSFNFSGGPVSGTGSLPVVNTGDFTATVSPFNTSLGALTSFNVDWLVTLSGSGTGDYTDDPDDSNAYGGGGGGLYISSYAYKGIGGGNTGLGGPGENVSFSATVSDNTTFLASNAGITYSPDLLAAVTGGSDVNLLWDTGFAPTYIRVDNFTASAIGRVILTYDYTAAVPTPATFTLFGLGLAGLGWSRRNKV